MTAGDNYGMKNYPACKALRKRGSVSLESLCGNIVSFNSIMFLKTNYLQSFLSVFPVILVMLFQIRHNWVILLSIFRGNSGTRNNIAQLDSSFRQRTGQINTTSGGSGTIPSESKKLVGLSCCSNKIVETYKPEKVCHFE